MRACVRACRVALLSWLKLVNIKYDPAFICPVCCHLPDHKKSFCMDGICMGQPRSMQKFPFKVVTNGIVDNM